MKQLEELWLDYDCPSTKEFSLDRQFLILCLILLLLLIALVF